MNSTTPPHINRRELLSRLTALSAATVPLLQGCAPTPIADTSGSTSAGSCVLTPTETEGPYPLSSVISSPALKRRDITEGKPGIPVKLQLKLHDTNNGCAPITDADIYIWHCDNSGIYSGYYNSGENATGQSYCRGIQPVDDSGTAHFDTIYPGWYPGRVTHIHFQIYHSGKTVTSQLAFPLAANREVYDTQHYVHTGQNNTVTELGDDFEFTDGAVYQTVALSGDVDTGLVATLEIGIRA